MSRLWIGILYRSRRFTSELAWRRTLGDGIYTEVITNELRRKELSSEQTKKNEVAENVWEFCMFLRGSRMIQKFGMIELHSVYFLYAIFQI